MQIAIIMQADGLTIRATLQMELRDIERRYHYEYTVLFSGVFFCLLCH